MIYRRQFLPALALILLAGCSTESDTSPTPEATGFAISEKDLFSEARDTCRARDPNFLSDLLSRISNELQPEQREMLRVHDFYVTDADSTGQREAIFRVKIDGQLMTATGPFRADDCEVGEMKLGIGPSSISTPDDQKVLIP